jgi:hypothetical protein
MGNKRRSLEERARLVAAFRASGLTQQQFADGEGIKVSALQSWLYKPTARRSAKPGSPGFVRVVEARADGGAVVRIGDAASITFDAAPSANYLAALLRALAC